MNGGINMAIRSENSAAHVHVRNFWSFLLLSTAAKKWSQTVMMIQEYCEVHYFRFKVIPDTPVIVHYIALMHACSPCSAVHLCI